MLEEENKSCSGVGGSGGDEDILETEEWQDMSGDVERTGGGSSSKRRCRRQDIS